MLRFFARKFRLVLKLKDCIGRESNPGLSRGRRQFYHWTTDALQLSEIMMTIFFRLKAKFITSSLLLWLFSVSGHKSKRIKSNFYPANEILSTIHGEFPHSRSLIQQKMKIRPHSAEYFFTLQSDWLKFQIELNSLWWKSVRFSRNYYYNVVRYVHICKSFFWVAFHSDKLIYFLKKDMFTYP